MRVRTHTTALASSASGLMQTNENNSHHRDLLIAVSTLSFMNPARTKRLVQELGTISSINNASPRFLATMLSISEEEARILRSPLAIPEIRAAVDAQRERVITLIDGDYPPLLREIPDPPSLLFAEGDRSLLRRPCLAIVGSRQSSPYGINAARLISRELARSGAVVISGFARGIDTAAHDEALLAGGSTVAVLGTGTDVDYPRENRKLRRRVIESGLLLTEFSPGTPPRAANFPVRNRIISGLSLGVVVVEASQKSGSLITARLASEQGREVFALPGSIFSRTSEGPHRLIQSGAKLVHSIDDLFEELGGILQAVAPRPMPALSDDARTVHDQLSADTAMHVDALVTSTGWENGRVAVALLELELSGAARAIPGQRYVRGV
jgi:DNA processing protein